ncbi:hypothetical protein PQX77_005665 [Marasmius sp. AFHP31]|nr:hypothetical protein PQX77_005665 [Marasmius sp. AFHP31]
MRRHGGGEGGVYVMQKESWDSPVSIQHTVNAKKNAIGGDLLVNLLQSSGIGKHVPPFKIMINPDDRPIIRKDWDLWEKAVKAARSGPVLSSKVDSGRKLRPGFLSSCSPSLLHDFPPSLFPARSQRHVKPSLRLPGPQNQQYHTLVHEHSSSMNPCLNPQLFRSHGQFLSFDGGRGAHLSAGGLGEDIDTEGEEGWVGVISYSPTQLHADLTAAIPLEWIDDSLPKNVLDKLEDYEAHNEQVPVNVEGRQNLPKQVTQPRQPSTSAPQRWTNKTDERLHWRGTNTGMFAGGDMEWDLGQRFRGVDFLGDISKRESGSVIHNLPAPFMFPYELDVIDPRTSNGGVVTINRTLYTSAFMDVSFSGSPISCSSPGVCEELLKRYTWAPPIGRNGVGEQRKYLLDLDGNAWSSRFKRLISSGSVVFKSTVYREWWSDRMQPWVHYVPVQVDLSDLWSVFLFFRGVMNTHEGESGTDGSQYASGGGGAHDELAKKIGDDGYEWSRTFWRREDMVAYNFRLLLEYARATSREREGMSYVYDPKDEV